jgi:methionine-rich copper-binding protein CopC
MRWAAVLAAAAAAGCAGNGEGLDQNGQPLGSGGSGGALTPDFTSIQDNVFTPICTRCHIGPSAPEGLQLDATHSYALLVGVPSVEQPSVLRVNPGNPDSSYMVLKLEGASGISGGRMPLGGPYLPQSTIDVIRQWITDGAPKPQATAHSETRPSFEVVATSPADTATVAAPVREITVAFSSEVEAALINWTTLKVEPVAGAEFLTPTSAPIASTFAIAPGNPATVLIHPVSPLGPGKYRVTVRGTGDSGALASVSGIGLGADYDFVFTVEAAR